MDKEKVGASSSCWKVLKHPQGIVDNTFLFPFLPTTSIFRPCHPKGKRKHWAIKSINILVPWLCLSPRVALLRHIVSVSCTGVNVCANCFHVLSSFVFVWAQLLQEPLFFHLLTPLLSLELQLFYTCDFISFSAVLFFCLYVRYPYVGPFCPGKSWDQRNTISLLWPGKAPFIFSSFPLSVYFFFGMIQYYAHSSCLYLDWQTMDPLEPTHVLHESHILDIKGGYPYH